MIVPVGPIDDKAQVAVWLLDTEHSSIVISTPFIFDELKRKEKERRKKKKKKMRRMMMIL